MTAPAAEVLLHGGLIRTADPAGTTTSAMAIGQGRVMATGCLEDVERLASRAAYRLDLDGATVMPGLCDTHMHLQKLTHDLFMVQLGDARTVADVVSRVADIAHTVPLTTWIRSFGDTEAWHENNLTEKRLPTRSELDAAAPGHPVFIYRRNDRAALNSVAARILSDLVDQLNDAEWVSQTGQLSGAAVREANDRIYRLSAADPGNEQTMLARTCQKLLKMGITAVADPGLAAGFDSAWDLYQTSARLGSLPQRVLLMNRLDYRRPFEDEFHRVLHSSAAPLEGDRHVRAWAVKLLLDGEFGNAWMRADGTLPEQGDARYTPEELTRVVELCGERGWPLCVHVMGDAAVAAVIDAVRSSRSRGACFYPGQVSLAHAFLMDRDAISAVRDLDVGVSVQPLLAYTFAHEMIAAWGERARCSNPLATMLSAGVRLAGGSDTLPCEPLRGAQIAVTRKAWDGTDLGSAEALTPEDAISLFTWRAGEYMGVGQLGTLVRGAPADITVWAEDPLVVDPIGWPEMSPELVVIGGAAVWPTDGGARWQFPEAHPVY